MLAGIALEEVLLIDQTKGQRLETLKQHLDILLTGSPIFLLVNIFPIENILSNTDLVGLHGPIIDPDTILDEMYLQLVGLSELDGEPDVRS